MPEYTHTKKHKRLLSNTMTPSLKALAPCSSVEGRVYGGGQCRGNVASLETAGKSEKFPTRQLVINTTQAFQRKSKRLTNTHSVSLTRAFRVFGGKSDNSNGILNFNF